MRVTARVIVAIAAIAVGLLPAVPAAALQSSLSQAAEALRTDTVYVAPGAESVLSSNDAARLRDRIRASGAGPMRIAVLPESALDEAGGDAAATLRRIALDVREPGTYAVVVGSQFRAGATGGVLPPGQAGKLASEAFQSRRSQGVDAVLAEFVGRVADERRSGTTGGREIGRDRDGGGGGGGLFLLLLLGIPMAIFGARRLGRRREERAQLQEVKEFAREDLIALGEDIRALELDVEMPDADPAAKKDYDRAVECYTAADEAWDRARRAEDMEHVTSALEEGRYAMTAARARLEGSAVPERRPPCFFDPRHGPSTTDAEWAPAGGAPRPVPVCAADAQRLEDGLYPDVRQVTVGGQAMPYWNAGPAYMPWAGGFFGSGLLPGLFIGSMLGGGLGLFGGLTADAFAHDHGGDMAGDFGGGFGGGDFGGGDFGGGDFGGGDF